jgi:parallel beta-helix repeat protein
MQTTFRRIVVVAAAACALAPASAQAAPGCGAAITASTTLRHDLTGCPGDGLVITADNVTLDLGGHMLAGSGTPGSAGVRLSGQHHVTIRNGTVKAFATGVALDHADGNRLRRLALQANAGRAMDLTSANANTIERVAASGNRTGVALTGSRRNVVRDSVLRANAITGVLAIGAAGNRIERNTIDGSSNGVALVEGSDGNAVGANAISHADSGVDIDGSSRNLLFANRFSDNGDGVLLSSGDANRVALNLVRRSTGCADGCGRGIAVDGGADNLVAANLVRGALTDGIAVAAAATGTVVQLNGASGAGDDGIDVDAAATTLRTNIAFGNHDLGIEAVPGVRDRGGNRAFRNGNPAQCAGLRCSGGQRGHRR